MTEGQGKYAAHTALFVVTVCFTIPALAQSGKTVTVPGYISPSKIPSELISQFLVLGDRLEKPGNARATLVGILTDRNGASAVKVVSETGSRVRVDWTGTPSKRLTFDGSQGRGDASSLSEDEQDILESLVDDMPDALMQTISRGSGLRLLGRGFQLPGGGACDLYDVPYLAKTRSKVPQNKRYCFDTTTCLLRWVEYGAANGPPGTVVQTQVSDWRAVSGQRYPGKVVRIQGGSVKFTLDVAQVSIGAAVEDNLFGP